MFVPIHGAAGAHAAQKAEEERRRKREEEEVMTGYRPDELAGNWQFKIVKGTFKTAEQIDRVVHEQSEHGWVLVEVFDHNRVRFKRPAGEVEKDAFREGNPYKTVSKASGPGCGTTMVVLLVGLVGTLFWMI